MIIIPHDDSKGFDVKSYAGSASPQDLLFEFSPDFFLTKRTTAVAGLMFDAVGGAAPFNTSGATARASAVAGFSFGADKITLPANTAGLSSTGGSFNAIALKEGVEHGFDIVTWTGDGTGSRNIAHGLGVTPGAIIARGVGAALFDAGGETPGAWPAAGLAFEMAGNNSAASGFLPGTATSSTFAVTSSLNANGATYIAYVFASVAGFSAMSSYTGNGTSQTIVTGFKPRALLLRRLAGVPAVPTLMFDENLGANPLTTARMPFSAGADVGTWTVSLLANGFSLNDGNASYNQNAIKYGYMAWA
jgi:hypothetical protein